MYSPWLFPYYPQNLPNLPANWIRQFNTPILLPWSELYSAYSQMFLQSFINCIQFMLDTFPACDLILSNIFYWYETNFGNVSVPRHVLLPTNTTLVLLPWNRLKPTPQNIAGFHRLLQQVCPNYFSKRKNKKKYFSLMKYFQFFFSIFPIVIHFWVIFFCVLIGCHGFIPTFINGIIQREFVYYPLCC